MAKQTDHELFTSRPPLPAAPPPQATDALGREAEALRASPSPLLAAQQARSDCLADKAKFEAVIDNCQVGWLCWRRGGGQHLP
jgi:hypothetical protein